MIAYRIPTGLSQYRDGLTHGLSLLSFGAATRECSHSRAGTWSGARIFAINVTVKCLGLWRGKAGQPREATT